MNWSKVIVFIIGILMGWWLAATDSQPTLRQCMPICVEMYN